MRLLQLSNKAPYPPSDGSAIAIYNMAKGFLDNKVDLKFLTINTKKHFKEDELVPESFRMASNYASVYKDTDVKFTSAIRNLFTNQSYFVSRFYFHEFEEKLISIFRKEQFDWVQLEGIFMASYIPLIRKFSKAKIAIRTHNVEHLIWERMIANESNPIKKSYLNIQNKRLKHFELDVLSKADALITITDQDKKYFEELGIQNKFHVSPTGIDLERYRIMPEQLKSNTVFHFGSMDWMPNREAVEWFLKKVWLQHFANDVQHRLVIAGRGMDFTTRSLSYPNVEIIPEVKDNIAFYNEHNIMVVPLLSGSGMRIKIIEGMAMGKAIVSTSIGVEGIPAIHGKHLLIADEPESFAAAVKSLFENESLRKRLSANARSFIETHFNNTAIVGDLIHFYKNN